MMDIAPEPAPAATRASRTLWLTQHTPLLVALVLLVWTVGLVGGARSLSAREIRGADFSQFYTMACIASEGRWEQLTSAEAFQATIAGRLGVDAHYPPVYPPHVAFVFSPISVLPYGLAFALWAFLTLSGSLLCLHSLLRLVPELSSAKSAIVAGFLLYPALLHNLAIGQLGLLGLMAMTFLARSVEHRSFALMTSGFALLSYKPSLFAPACVVLVVARNWRAVAACLAGGLLPVAATLPFVGAAPWYDYATRTLGYLRQPDQLAKPAIMVSLRTSWPGLAPEWITTALYLLTASAALLLASRTWNRSRTTLDRVGALGLGTVLISPHVYFYDLLIIVPTYLGLFAHSCAFQGARAVRWLLVCAFVAPLLGAISGTIHVQPATLALFALLIATLRSSQTSCEAQGAENTAMANETSRA